MSTAPEPDLSSRLLRDDILRERDGEWTLVGTRCDKAHASFPPTATCPICLSTAVEPAELPRTGRIFAHTTVRMPSANFKPPYSIGYVQLDGGPRVFAHFDAPSEALKIGAPVVLQVKPMWEDEGRPVIAYCFTLVPGAAHA